MPARQRDILCAVGALGALATAALAGGGPDNVLLLINPSDPDALYIGNLYKQARGLADANVLYINHAAPNYSAFIAPGGPLQSVQGHIAASNLQGRIDYIVIAASPSFFLQLPVTLTDFCFPINRISVTSAFTTGQFSSQVATGQIAATTANGYFSVGVPAAAQNIGFDSETRYLGGLPSAGVNDRRFYIASVLGYTGQRGLAASDVAAMISRSVAADFTRPTGTFYFMNNAGDSLRNVRAAQYSGVINTLSSFGATGTVLDGTVPSPRFDILGVITGTVGGTIENGSTMTMLGAPFADHLTSYSATFDTSDQEKCVAWIKRGAVATSGTVEEPCNYTGKFPNANIHALLVQGMSMGEAWLRSLQFIPVQQMLIGDPLARPFTRPPVVDLEGLPASGPVSGWITITPTATPGVSGASILSYQLIINGTQVRTIAPGFSATINTGALPDGPSEFRVVAVDSTPYRNTGVFSRTVNVDNSPAWVSLSAPVTTGDLGTRFNVTLNSGGGGTVTEARLLHNGRVIAAAPGPLPVQFSIPAGILGAGTSTLHAEATYAEVFRSRSQPVQLQIAPTGSPSSFQTPVAFSFRDHVARGATNVVELPAFFDDALATATYEILTPPTQATVTGSGPWRTLTVSPTACGSEPMTFRVSTPSGVSQVATVTLEYGAGPRTCPVDIDGDGLLTVQDYSLFMSIFANGNIRADMDANCQLNVGDFSAFLQLGAAGCP